MRPPEHWKAGDVVELGIDELGEMRLWRSVAISPLRCQGDSAQKSAKVQIRFVSRSRFSASNLPCSPNFFFNDTAATESQAGRSSFRGHRPAGGPERAQRLRQRHSQG